MNVYHVKSYNFSELGREEKETAIEEVVSNKSLLSRSMNTSIINEFKKKAESMGLFIDHVTHRVTHEMDQHDGDNGVSFVGSLKLTQKIDEDQFEDELFKRVVRLNNDALDTVERLFSEEYYALINIHNSFSMAPDSSCMGVSFYYRKKESDNLLITGGSSGLESTERKAYASWYQEMFCGVFREMADELNESLVRIYEESNSEEAVRKRLQYGDLSDIEFCESGELFEKTDLMNLVE